MDLDGQTIGAITGFLGLVVSTIGGVFIATRANKTEKTDAAQKALDATKDEIATGRMTLRDEQIASLREDLAEEKADKAELKAENAALKEENASLRAQLNSKEV